MRFVQRYLRFTAVLQATLTTTILVTASCSKKDDDTRGFGPFFRANFPGEPCEDLRLTVGHVSELCAKPEWMDLCSSRVMRDEWEVAIVHGDYIGPVCERNADECGPAEKVSITAGATRMAPNDNWTPPFGEQKVGGRTIDVGKTLAVGGLAEGAGAPQAARRVSRRTLEARLRLPRRVDTGSPSQGVALDRRRDP